MELVDKAIALSGTVVMGLPIQIQHTEQLHTGVGVRPGGTPLHPTGWHATSPDRVARNFTKGCVPRWYTNTM